MLAQRRWAALVAWHRTVPILKRAGLWVVLLALGVATSAASATTAGFDTDRALANVTYLAQTIGERPAGSPGEELAAGWLAASYGALGYTVRIQPFAYTRRGEPVSAVNVIAVKPGVDGYGTLYIGAHDDTVAGIPSVPLGGPGANDNASGAGVLLEAARVLATEPLSQTVVFLAFGAEEDGLVGSYYFVDQMTPVERLQAAGMLDLDCVGLGDRFDLIVRRAKDLSLAASLDVGADTILEAAWVASDHIPFALNDIPAVLFNVRPERSACGPDYHSPTDTVDKLNADALARAGNALLAAVRQLDAAAEPRSVTVLHLPVVAR